MMKKNNETIINNLICNIIGKVEIIDVIMLELNKLVNELKKYEHFDREHREKGVWYE